MKDRNEIRKMAEDMADRLFKKDSNEILSVTESSLWNDRRHNIIAGYSEASKDSDELACAFAEWIGRKTRHSWFRFDWTKRMWREPVSSKDLNSADLLSLFRESNEYKQLKNK